MNKAIGWRAMRKDDIVRGVCVRWKGMEDTPFRGGVVIKANVVCVTPFFLVARPYAYANRDYDDNQPLIGAEVVDCYSTDGFEVYETKDGGVKMSVT